MRRSLHLVKVSVKKAKVEPSLVVLSQAILAAQFSWWSLVLKTNPYFLPCSSRGLRSVEIRSDGCKVYFTNFSR